MSRQMSFGEEGLTETEILAKLAALESELEAVEDEKQRVSTQYRKKIQGIRNQIGQLVARYHEQKSAQERVFALHSVDPYYQPEGES